MIFVYYTSYWIYLAILLLNVLLYSVRVKKDSDKALKILLVYLWTMFIVQVVSDVMTYIASDNLYFTHIYLCTHFILLGSFYKTVFTNLQQRNFVILSLSVIFLFLILQYSMYPELFSHYNLSEIFAVNYLVTVYSLIYNYNSLSVKIQFPYINWGVMTYSILSTALFLYGNIATKLDLKISIPVWIIHLLVIIFLQSMIFIQWLKCFYKNKSYAKFS